MDSTFKPFCPRFYPAIYINIYMSYEIDIHIHIIRKRSAVQVLK